jgi:hypothetical protein
VLNAQETREITGIIKPAKDTAPAQAQPSGKKAHEADKISDTLKDAKKDTKDTRPQV